jgi:hypothetical protein
MFFRIKTSNYFLYNKEERTYYLREAVNYYLDRYVSRETNNVYYVGVQELRVFFKTQELNAVDNENFEEAEIYNKLGEIFDTILDRIKQDVQL